MSGFVYNGTVDFHDTDAGGVVHFTNYLKWVERAEGLWFASLGVAQFERLADGSFTGFPRVEVKCDYRSPLLPGAAFAVVLLPEKAGCSSLTYRFEVRKGGEEGMLAAEGAITIVHAEVKCGGEKFKAVPLPPALTGLNRAS